jgi:signal transduction histidine kinase
MHAPIEAAVGLESASRLLTPRLPLAASQRSRLLIMVIALLLIALICYIDYVSGYEQTMLLFYLVPVAIGTWFGNAAYGFTLSMLSVIAWVISDLAAGVPFAGIWNVAMAAAAYGVFTIMLWKLRTLVLTLDERVRDRTEALRHEMAERQRLDREISGIAERERRRLGQELHDTICQHLTGTALTAETLREKLAGRAAAEVSEADKVVGYIEEGIDLARNLARGFFAPELDAEGLLTALQSLAGNTSEGFEVECHVDADSNLRVGDAAVATQLYKIAQEAVRNAVKHSHAQKIEIRLFRKGRVLTLAIADDGIGIPERLPQPEGLGLRLMAHGAAMIGARFRAASNGTGGTTVTCELNIEKETS